MTRSGATEATWLPGSLAREGSGHSDPDRAYLGVGLYSLAEAARLLRMPVVTLRYWANEGRPTAGRQPTPEPLIRREDPELMARGLFTFPELVSLLLIRQLRQAGLSLATIRSLAQQAAAAFQTSQPFATRRFYTEGPPLLAQAGDAYRRAAVLAAGGTRLPVSEALLADFADQLDYAEDGAVFRYWPAGRERRVVLDPARALGQPSDPISAVPTRVLAGMVAAGEPVDEVAQWYRVDREAVRDAVEFEQSLSSARLPRAA